MAQTHVGYPVALSPSEAIIGPLAVEARGRMAKQHRVDVLESVDADHGVKPAVDRARDDRHDSAARADVELGRAGAEAILRHERRVLDAYFERSLRVGRPYAAVLDAERARARARRNLGGIGFPREREPDVPAMTAAADEQGLAELYLGRDESVP